MIKNIKNGCLEKFLNVTDIQVPDKLKFMIFKPLLNIQIKTKSGRKNPAAFCYLR